MTELWALSVAQFFNIINLYRPVLGVDPFTGMGFALRVRSAGQKYGPTCHQRDRVDVTEFVTLVRLSSLGQHVGVLALAGYKRRKSALTAGPVVVHRIEVYSAEWKVVQRKGLRDCPLSPVTIQ